MPVLADDRAKQIAVSSAMWHDLAFHNAATKIRHRRLREELARGVNVREIETGLPTGKTCQVNRYGDRIREVAQCFRQLFRFYMRMRRVRWRTYQREQRALHQICLHIKGDRHAKRSDVVVAFGAASFGSAMRGVRGVPVKKFRKYLARYVTLVLVDEFRTSRVCSHLCALEEAPSPAAAEADEGAAEPDHALVAAAAAAEDEDEDDEEARREWAEEEERATRER